MYADEAYEAVQAAIEGIQIPTAAKARQGDKFVFLPPGTAEFTAERQCVLEGAIPPEQAGWVLLSEDAVVIALSLGVGYLTRSDVSTKRALRDAQLINAALLELEASATNQIANISVQGQGFAYQEKMVEVSYLLTIRFDPRTPEA